MDSHSVSDAEEPRDRPRDTISRIKQEYSTIFIFTEPQPCRNIHYINDTSSTKRMSKHSRMFYESALEPFHVSLRIFGMMYTVDSDKRFNISKWYHRYVAIVMWLNFLRFFAAYNLGEAFGFLVTSKIIIHGILFWSVSGCVAATVMAKQRPIIFKTWLKYRNNYNLTFDQNYRKLTKRRVVITLVSSWLILIIATVIFTFVYDNNQIIFILRLALLPFVDICDEQFHTFLYFLVILFINLFNMSICGFQLGYMLLIVMGITDEFSHFNAQFHKCITHSPQTSIDLEYWRKQHLELSKLTDMVDTGFGLYILLLFVTNIGVCCCLVYMTIFTMAQGIASNNMASMLVIFISYLILSVGIILIITYAGTKLNTQVIYYIFSKQFVVLLEYIVHNILTKMSHCMHRMWAQLLCFHVVETLFEMANYEIHKY